MNQPDLYQWGIEYGFDPDEWAQTPDSIKEHMRTLEGMVEDYRKTLELIPECPEHGFCLPYFTNWINVAKMKTPKVEIYR